MGRAFSPLDEELGLLPGRYTPHLQECVALLGTLMPFDTAVQVLKKLQGVSASKSSAVRVTEAAGAAYVAMQDEAVAELERTAVAAPVGVKQLVVSADGAMAPLLHGEWGEVRTLAIGEAICLAPVTTGEQVSAPARNAPGKRWRKKKGKAQNGSSLPHPSQQGWPDNRTHNMTYFSRLTSAETFTRLALVETHRRGVENSHQVAAVMDGAEWLQGFVDHHCPQAVRILDFPHAAQRIAEIGQNLFGTEGAGARSAHAEQAEQATAWSETWIHSLKYAGPLPLLAELQRLRKLHPHNETLRSNLAYLQKRQPQMQYPHFAQQGWPIASGMVESANKLVVEARLKGSGMHWQPSHVDAMLALRPLLQQPLGTGVAPD